VQGDRLVAWCYSRPEPPGIHGATPPGSGTLENDLIELYGIYALPGFDRRGVFEALLSTAAESAFARGATRVCTVIAAGNDVLRSAAEASGFRVTTVEQSRRVLGRSSPVVVRVGT
jgi:hypothetical protein